MFLLGGNHLSLIEEVAQDARAIPAIYWSCDLGKLLTTMKL